MHEIIRRSWLCSSSLVSYNVSCSPHATGGYLYLVLKSPGRHLKPRTCMEAAYLEAGIVQYIRASRVWGLHRNVPKALKTGWLFRRQKKGTRRYMEEREVYVESREVFCRGRWRKCDRAKCLCPTYHSIALCRATRAGISVRNTPALSQNYCSCR